VTAISDLEAALAALVPPGDAPSQSGHPAASKKGGNSEMRSLLGTLAALLGGLLAASAASAEAKGWDSYGPGPKDMKLEKIQFTASSLMFSPSKAFPREGPHGGRSDLFVDPTVERIFARRRVSSAGHRLGGSLRPRSALCYHQCRFSATAFCVSPRPVRRRRIRHQMSSGDARAPWERWRPRYGEPQARMATQPWAHRIGAKSCR